MSKLVRFLIPILIAVVLGPLIAGVAVTVLALVLNLVDRTATVPVGDVLAVAGFYITFAYVAGAAIALLAGLLVSLWMLSRPPSLLVVIGAAVLATAVYMGIGAMGVLGEVESANAHNNFLFTLIFAVIAAAGCWLLTGRFARTA